MKKLVLTLIVIISLCSTNFSYGADRFVTLHIDETGSKASASVNIAANEVAWVLWISSLNAQTKIEVTYGSGTRQLPLYTGVSASNIFPNIPLVGPCAITYSTGATGNNANVLDLTTIKIQPNPNINGVGQ